MTSEAIEELGLKLTDVSTRGSLIEELEATPDDDETRASSSARAQDFA
ncbi:MULTISPECIES: hypothetical protein [unclassified Rhizobium]|nr:MULTISPECIES: hypothetical protein [unclassified Rhizobium]